MINRISAKIITDSITEREERLTTFVLVFPRIILAEFNTHRMISKNSASSRAIPFKTMLQKVKDEPFIPIAWQKDHSGMQGNEYFTNEEVKEYGILDNYMFARDAAIFAAKKQAQITKLTNGKWLGVTKQLCNRLLEPFMYHIVICTGSEWQNFFALRAHPAAEIHIADLANKMLIAYNESSPKLLNDNEWHIPFGDTFDKNRLYTMIEADHGVYDPVLIHNELQGDTRNQDLIDKYKLKIATARCARISYNNFEGKDDYHADIKLHDTLHEMGHMSPFEHCAKAMTDEEFYGDIPDEEANYTNTGWSGNFRGFVQYRKLFNDENKQDSRVLQK